jgi:hypothetical protein
MRASRLLALALPRALEQVLPLLIEESGHG